MTHADGLKKILLTVIVGVKSMKRMAIRAGKYRKASEKRNETD